MASTDLRAAAQQALEALDDARHHMSAMGAFTEIQLSAQDALRAALAEPVQDERTTIADLRCAKWLDPECADKGACQSLKFKRSAEPVQDSEWEVRADGKRVRKDRWQIGIRRIVALLWGNRQEFEVDEVVEAVRHLVPNPYAEGDDEALVSAALAEPVQEPPQDHFPDATKMVQEPGCRDDGMPASAEERHLRRLLALRAAMPHTYYDDGEAQGIEHGISIDFMREPVAHIDAKLRALNVARMIAKEAQPVQGPQGCGVCNHPLYAGIKCRVCGRGKA